MPSNSSLLVPAQICHIDKLPYEILDQVFRKLLLRKLKLVRLCCRRWAIVSTRHMFEQIYFTPRSESIRRFEHIVQEPHLAKCVKHLVFDDTQLPKRLLWHELHSSALVEDRVWSRSEQIAAHAAFWQYYRDQEQIRATSKDLTTLLHGLPKLPRLRKVSVIGGPSHLSQLRVPQGPHARDLAGTCVAASYWSYRKEKKAYYEAWGSHRVQHLFQALSSAKICLGELHIGNWQEYPRPLKMGLPLLSLTAHNAIDQARFVGHAQSVFSHLTELNMQIDSNRRVKGRDYSARDFEPLFQILSSMTLLKRLAFGVTQWTITFDVYQTQRLLSTTWPALKAIKLRCVRVDPDTLLNFFTRHKDTLTALFLHHVGFEPNTPHTWLDVARRVGQILHLENAELDVYEWGDDSDISGWQIDSTEVDLAVILGGRHEAVTTNSGSSNGERANGGSVASLPVIPKETPQCPRCQNSGCRQCGGWLKNDARANNRH